MQHLHSLTYTHNPVEQYSYAKHHSHSHALPYYINLVISRCYHCLVVLIPRRLEVQISSNVADQGKYTIKSSVYQVYEQMRIKYTRVSVELVCIFAIKFEIKVFGSTISPRITKYEENPSFQWKPSINSENF